jgi:CheY-like chemotaxis protein
VLYLSPSIPRLLGVDSANAAVGGALGDLFPPRHRLKLAMALQSAARDGRAAPVGISLKGVLGQRVNIELTALCAKEASPPVDVLYVRAARDGFASGESQSMSTRERTPGEPSPTTVLICDDEARLGVLTAGLLAEYGFVPVTVGTGEEALRVLAAKNPPIDVVLLDVNLSMGRSAREVLVAMQRLGEGARVVLTSGLAEEDVDADLIAHPSVVGYVAKPYGVDQLISRIRSALHR